MRAAVQYVERMELDAPAVVEAITDLRIEEPGRWRDKGIVFGERTRPEIAIAQCREPAGFFAEPDPGRSDYVRRARNVVARSIPDLSGGKPGERSIQRGLFRIVATEARMRRGNIGFEAEPWQRMIVAGPFDAVAAARLGRLATVFPAVNRRSNLTPVLPHLRMLLSHVGYSADGRRVRGFVHARTIEGTGGVAECPLHAASPPVPGSPAGAAAPSDMRGMIVSVALRLSDRNKRCTMVCCGGPNCSEQRSARRPRMASAVRRGSAASQRSMSARCGSSIDGILMRFLYGLWKSRWIIRCSPRCTSLPSPFPNAAAFVAGAGGLAAAASLPVRAPTRVPSSAWASLISASRATGSSVQ